MPNKPKYNSRSIIETMNNDINIILIEEIQNRKKLLDH